MKKFISISMCLLTLFTTMFVGCNAQSDSIFNSAIVAEASVKTYSVPNGKGSFKSYTNYKLLNKRSPQWTKIQCNKNAYTDKNGLRKVGKYYCVAMGTYYTKTLGDLFKITTTNGSFYVVICDWKANKDTDRTNRYTLSNGCMVEFYVNSNTLNRKARQMGDISYAEKKFSGKIIKIQKIGNYFKR